MNDVFDEAIKRNPHLLEYINEFQKTKNSKPLFISQIPREMALEKTPNIIYPVGDPIFIHIYGEAGKEIQYIVIEPRLNKNEIDKYNLIVEKVLEKGLKSVAPVSKENLKKALQSLFENAVTVSAPEKKLFTPPPIQVTREEYDKFRYLIVRDIIDSGPVEAATRDPYLEDIHCIGLNPVSLVHKIFGPIKTNIRFDSKQSLDNWLRTMSERIGRPIGDANPIAGGTLPSGSRIAIAYSDDISRRGSSFTIRKFTSTPLSITQLIKWGTMSSEEAAYLWLCLENGMSVFLCGETASGKTAALNATLVFIDTKAKIYSAEDATEVTPPHDVWQQLATKEEGPEESQVQMFTLLKAALRSRPNYIIVGEIRGIEGAVAFQAMQTGHPVMATFHASSVKRMIQRFIGAPINVPVTFIDNLNVCVVLHAMYREGILIRRIAAIEELEGYYEEAGGVMTRAVFQWNPATDKHDFRGANNSYILEEKIAVRQGYKDKRKIYDELFTRARILDAMVNRGIFDFMETFKIVKAYREHGIEGLPFPL
ncbi:MAG: type II/IV secretion system ATPase subunit [Candidatus Methanoperedens sp.]|nr:type II/IV secretion system ATPase subunit [Candidatus Methanoperedens sp.]